jgi:hypothetical protein
MAASELSVQPQLAQAAAFLGRVSVKGNNKQQQTSGVVVPRRSKAEIFMASPESNETREAHPRH